MQCLTAGGGAGHLGEVAAHIGAVTAGAGRDSRPPQAAGCGAARHRQAPGRHPGRLPHRRLRPLRGLRGECEGSGISNVCTPSIESSEFKSLLPRLPAHVAPAAVHKVDALFAVCSAVWSLPGMSLQGGEAQLDAQARALPMDDQEDAFPAAAAVPPAASSTHRSRRSSTGNYSDRCLSAVNTHL